jgi:guanylate kinase
MSISCTTRNRRPYEIDGKDYFFITKEEFENKIKNNEMFE